jgi:hypothetical protein
MEGRNFHAFGLGGGGGEKGYTEMGGWGVGGGGGY